MRKKGGGIFYLPNDLFKMNLDPISFMIYAYLISVKELSQRTSLSVSTISQELNIPKSIVKKRLQLLEEQAYVHHIHNLDLSDETARFDYSTRYAAYNFEKPWCRAIFSHKHTEKPSN